MNSLVNRLIPINSHRRILARILREAVRSPRSLPARLNGANFANFLKYRKHRFICPVCGGSATPLYDFPDLQLRQEHKIGVLRETLQCRQCLASLRQRSLALALLGYLNDRWDTQIGSITELAAHGLGGLRVFDTDNFSAMSRLLRDVPGFVRCSYVPNKPWGSELAANCYNIDLQRIDFADESFDIVLTSDVMEHVRDCDAAHAEIYRVLSDEGTYVFNVPYDENMADDIQLVDTSTDKDAFLCKPQIHGDPLTGGILAYRVFGRQLIRKLESLGFEVMFQRIEQASSLVVDGDVFVARKPGNS